MKQFGLVVGITILVFGLGIVLGRASRDTKSTNPNNAPTSATISPINFSHEVELNKPKPNQIAVSPLEVEGKIKRSWTFEAVMSVWILDGKRNVIGGGPVYTTAENETDEWVNFSTIIPFEAMGETGFLQIKNDNPSGLPENEKVLEIPLKFR